MSNFFGFSKEQEEEMQAQLVKGGVVLIRLPDLVVSMFKANDQEFLKILESGGSFRVLRPYEAEPTEKPN